MSLFSRLFPSKLQRSIDALQETLNRRLVAVDASLKLFTITTDAFHALNPPPESDDWAAFKLAQGKHQYFTNALIDDLGRAEDRIKQIRLAANIGGKAAALQLAAEILETEDMLKETGTNVDRLAAICDQMRRAVGV